MISTVTIFNISGIFCSTRRCITKENSAITSCSCIPNGDASFFPTGDFEYLADLMSDKLRAQSGERQLRNLAVNFEVEIKHYANRLFNLFEDVQEARQK